jgi:hypothetical protein
MIIWLLYTGINIQSQDREPEALKFVYKGSDGTTYGSQNNPVELNSSHFFINDFLVGHQWHTHSGGLFNESMNMNVSAAEPMAPFGGGELNPNTFATKMKGASLF